MTLVSSPNWCVMLSMLFMPSLLYLFVTIFHLPKSSHWLIIKGWKEAWAVLEMLHGWDDITCEMALIVKGLNIGDMLTSRTMSSAHPRQRRVAGENEQPRDTVTLYGPEQGLS
ncbi:hypothetical protein E2562_015145 [Oryza meyeriana var. granulata]|uniref:Major facilitator superfamily (MFS) profile domain-containing protein n=1 Tax=Oryza meyeriana var. granulata TaxID=110450 RepID=A0A6G1DWU0_9ORYZ|nr:hypothetical protein E2562_015145 [Oryza meyeriana var. granulata]